MKSLNDYFNYFGLFFYIFICILNVAWYLRKVYSIKIHKIRKTNLLLRLYTLVSQSLIFRIHCLPFLIAFLFFSYVPRLLLMPSYLLECSWCLLTLFNKTFVRIGLPISHSTLFLSPSSFSVVSCFSTIMNWENNVKRRKEKCHEWRACHRWTHRTSVSSEVFISFYWNYKRELFSSFSFFSIIIIIIIISIFLLLLSLSLRFCSFCHYKFYYNICKSVNRFLKRIIIPTLAIDEWQNKQEINEMHAQFSAVIFHFSFLLPLCRDMF